MAFVQHHCTSAGLLVARASVTAQPSLLRGPPLIARGATCVLRSAVRTLALALHLTVSPHSKVIREDSTACTAKVCT